MIDRIKERCQRIGMYMIEKQCTIREAAKALGVSKSTAHRDVDEWLKIWNRQLYNEVQKVLEKNKEERHIRGGQTTKQRYQKISHKK